MKDVKRFYILVFVTMIAVAIVRPAIPIILRDSGANGFQIGLVAALFMIFRAGSASINGYLWDKKKSNKFLIPLSFIFISLIFFGYYFFATFMGFLILRSIQGMLSGTLWPILQIETLKRSGDNSSKAMSFYYIIGNIGGVLGILLSAPVLLAMMKFTGNTRESEVLPLMFIVSGAIILFLGLLSHDLRVGEKYEDEEEIDKAGKKDEPRVFFFFILLFSFLSGSIGTTLNSIIIVFIKEFLKLDTVNTTLVYGTLVLISSVFIWVFNVKITAKKWKNAAASVLTLLTISLCAFYFPMTPLPTLFFLLLVFIGVKAIVPLTRNLTFVLFPGKTGSRIGVLNSISNIGSFLGPILAGFAYDNFSNKLLTFPITGVLFLIASAAFLIAVKKNKKKSKDSGRIE